MSKIITITFDDTGNSSVDLGSEITPQNVSVAACHLIGMASHTIQGCSKIGKPDTDDGDKAGA